MVVRLVMKVVSRQESARGTGMRRVLMNDVSRFVFVVAMVCYGVYGKREMIA